MTFDPESLASQDALRLPIDVQPLGHDLVVVSVHGDIDLQEAGELRAVLNDACTGPHHTIQVDLADVHFISSSGMGVLAELSHRMSTQDRRLEAHHASEVIRSAFAIAGLGHVLEPRVS